MDEKIKQITDLLTLSGALLEDGMEQRIYVDNGALLISKEDGKMYIAVEEGFIEGDTVKDAVKDYKEAMEALDGNTFLEVLEEMKEEIDIQEFDELLDLEDYNEEDAERVLELIEQSTEIVQEYLQNKIESLVNVFEKFGEI